MINDTRIIELNNSYNLIVPFVSSLVRYQEGKKVISYGLSSFGYDIRLSSVPLLFFQSSQILVDPKNFNPKAVQELSQYDQDYFLMPPQSTALGVSLERITMPNNLTALVVGKSTYARCGLLVNVTPLEAGWKGFITMELTNLSKSPLKVYHSEGIAQLLFFEGQKASVTYDDRQGKYQNQGCEIVFPKI